MRPASRPRPRTRIPGLACRLMLRAGQVNDRGVPGLVVLPGGARVGVSHSVLEAAERPAGIEVQRRK